MAHQGLKPKACSSCMTRYQPSSGFQRYCPGCRVQRFLRGEL